MKKLRVIFIIGPTAVGKSAFAVNLAHETNGEIVSADSMQIYKGLNLGTSKLSMKERQGIPHHMIDVIDPHEDFSAAEYSVAAQAVIDAIAASGKQPIVCGGSGLFVHSLLYELDFAGRMGDMKLRECLEREAEEKGPDFVYAKLLKLDPAAAERIHPNNVKRVIRAIERAAGDIECEGLRSFSNTYETPQRYDSHIIRLSMDRTALYARINRRAEVFFEKGLMREVRGLLESGVPGAANSMQGIGYKECIAALEGKIDEEEALRLVQQNTRRYAKRQETWFKRYDTPEKMRGR